MDNSILTAILALAGTLVGSFSGVVTSARLTNYRIKQLEIKVDKHNCLVERMVAVEVKLADLEKE